MNKTRFYSIPDIELPIERHSLPQPGIYFLWLGNSLRYIGKSSNILKRVGEHISVKDFDSYSIIECDISEMDRLEIAYIKKYNPPLNEIHTVHTHASEVIDLSEYASIINNMRSSVGDAS